MVRFRYLAIYLILAAVTYRTLTASYDESVPVDPRVYIYLAAYAALLVSEPLLTRRLGWFPCVYLIAQTGLVVAMLFSAPQLDFLPMLFIPLSFQAVLTFQRRVGFVWIAAFCLAMAYPVLLGWDWQPGGLVLVLAYTPSEGEKGVIKPLDKKFTPLIAWRVRDLAATESRVVMTGIHSCANCHSDTQDGSTMGMDLDGPNNNKGLYALFPIRPQATIRAENVVEWSTFRGTLGGKLRVAFMSQVSPDGRYVVTRINDPGPDQSDYQRRQFPKDLQSTYYVANFKDYRFLQVFYPTRGILAWYSQTTGKLQPLPGVDEPRYVHTNAVWTPDGKSLVFTRAEVLEVGCGTGAILQEIRSPASPHGLDLDSAALYKCRFHAPGVSLTCSDVHHLPYPNRSFDIDMCHFLLLWVRDPLQVVCEMARVGLSG